MEKYRGKKTPKYHSPQFNAKVALADLKGDQTMAELSQRFDAHRNQIAQWKAQILDRSVNEIPIPIE
jgi:transposase